MAKNLSLSMGTTMWTLRKCRRTDVVVVVVREWQMVVMEVENLSA